MRQKIVDNIEQVGTATAYGASGTTLFMGLTVDEWGIAAAVIGIIGVIATFSFNAWFKLKYHTGTKR